MLFLVIYIYIYIFFIIIINIIIYIIVLLGMKFYHYTANSDALHYFKFLHKRSVLFARLQKNPQGKLSFDCSVSTNILSKLHM